MGLLSMRKRTELARGRFAMLSRLGQGTLVRALVPLDPGEPVSWAADARR